MTVMLVHIQICARLIYKADIGLLLNRSETKVIQLYYNRASLLIHTFKQPDKPDIQFPLRNNRVFSIIDMIYHL